MIGGKYGLGTVRKLCEYEEKFGLSFKYQDIGDISVTGGLSLEFFNSISNDEAKLNSILDSFL